MNFSNSDKLNLQNYLRLKFLLLNYGNKVLQNLLLKRYTASPICYCQSGEITKSLQCGTFANTKKLPSTSMARKPVGESIDQWDFTLLSSVLLELNATSSTAHSTVADENQHIVTLRNLRNDLEHTPAVYIPEHNFKHYWSAALNALAALGGSPEEIEHIRTTTKLGGVEFEIIDIINKDSILKANYLRREGKAAVKEGRRFETGIKFYSQALLLSGISKDLRGKLFGNRCEAYLTLMEHENILADEVTSYSKLALSDFQQAILSCSSTFNSWKNWYKAGKVYKFLKNWREAIEYFDIALDFNPTILENVIAEREDCLQKYHGTTTLDLVNFRTLAEGAILSGYKELQEQDLNTRSEYVRNYLMQMEAIANLSSNAVMKVFSSIFLAQEYEKGMDLPVNLEKAVAYLQVGADAGHPGALWRLGKMFWCGKGVEQNIHRAVDLWQTAAYNDRDPTRPTSHGVSLENLGIAQALHSLAHCYTIGVGVHQNIEYAAELLVKSSMQGCATASRDLARMYASGCGVSWNSEIAIQYLKLAVEQGCPDSLMDLCWMYLKQCNPKQAEVWLSRALAAESPNAIIWRNKIEKKLKLVKQTSLKPDPQILITQHIPMTGPDSIPSEYRNLNIEKNRVCIQNENLQWPFPTEDLVKFFDLHEEIRLIPSKISGGYMETLAEYMRLFEEGLGELVCLESSEDYLEHKLARTSVLQKFAHCLELQETLPALPPDLQNKLLEIAEDAFTETNVFSEEAKCHARMCYVHLIKSSEKAITFVEKCTVARLYPSNNKPYFYQMHSNLLHAQQKFSEGLRVVEEGLQMFPDNYELLFHRAVHSRMCFFQNDIFLKHMVSIPAVNKPKFPRSINPADISTRKQKCDSVIQAYEEFIAKAPSDHWKISEAYYFIGNLLRTSFDFTRAEQYYIKGIDAETQFPPCVQNDTLGKQLAELLLAIKDTAQYASKQRFHELKIERFIRTTTKYGHPLMLFSNPKRVSIVFHHRENMMYFPPGTTRKLIDQTDPDVKTKLSHVQKAPVSTDNLKEIFLEDTDPTVDCFYENCFIDLVIMEDSLFEIELPIHSVVKDKNGEFQRLFIYNVDKKDSSVRKGLSFGSRIRIHNPSLFIKTSLDGVGLRVDDPNSLVFTSPGDKESLCRFCGQENANYNCIECKRVKYCDSKCQNRDDEVLFHSFICSKEVFEYHAPKTTSGSFDGWVDSMRV